MRTRPDTYFLTTAIAERRVLLQSDANASLLSRLTFQYRDEGRYFLHAFVVMPDHLHALLTPSYDQSIDRCMQCIKRGFSNALGNDSRHAKRIWQPGFRQQRVRDAEDYLRRRSYIAQNPDDWGLRAYPHVHFSGPTLDPMPRHLRV